MLAISANVTFGLLSGLSPLLVAGSGAAIFQTTLVMVLQFTMCLLCLKFLPDADRIVSVFMGTQFLMEGFSTMLALVAATTPTECDESANATLADQVCLTADQSADVVMVGFWLGVVAILVPMIQLIEQRLITPVRGVP